MQRSGANKQVGIISTSVFHLTLESCFIETQGGGEENRDSGRGPQWWVSGSRLRIHFTVPVPASSPWSLTLDSISILKMFLTSVFDRNQNELYCSQANSGWILIGWMAVEQVFRPWLAGQLWSSVFALILVLLSPFYQNFIKSIHHWITDIKRVKFPQTGKKLGSSARRGTILFFNGWWEIGAEREAIFG